MEDPKNDAGSDRRLTTDRRHPEDSSGDSSDDRSTKLAVLEQRLDQHDVEIKESHEARSEFIPRIILMESAILELTKQAVPNLTAAVDAMTKEMIASRASRRIVLQLGAWMLAILTTITGAVLSYKAIDALQQKRAAVTATAP